MRLKLMNTFLTACGGKGMQWRVGVDETRTVTVWQDKSGIRTSCMSPTDTPLRNTAKEVFLGTIAVK
jgi:hypothetical protein